jgi:nitrous-oxide reductase
MKMTAKIAVLFVILMLISAGARPAHAEDRTFTIVAEQIGKAKFWIPSTLMVNQGDKVKLVLKNEIEGADVTHGFELDGYGVKEVVTRGAPKEVTFTADKPGIFPYFCQLHPAHIGGELLVIPSK